MARERVLGLVYADRSGAADRAARVVLEWARDVSARDDEAPADEGGRDEGEELGRPETELVAGLVAS